MGFAAETLEHRLGNRLDQLLMRHHERTEPTLIVHVRPVILGAKNAVSRLRNVEGAPAPHPPLAPVGMDVASFLDREIALADRAVTRSAKTHLLGQRRG